MFSGRSDLRSTPFRSLLSTAWFGPGVVALLAWLALVTSVDPAGSYPNWPQGSGLTVDEMFNVQQGVYLVEAVRQYGLAMLDPASIQEIFGPGSAHLPDHPPFGRAWLGLHHHLTWAVAPPEAPFDRFTPVTACARTGSATSFALMILLIGWFTGRNFGVHAGLFAALFTVTMPRLWGHAHLASLETITNLMMTASVLVVAQFWNRTSPPTIPSSLLAGVVLGLTFLTKIQAILLPLPIIAWTLWKWRRSAIRPLICWGVTAAIVFLLGWPWLWLDPIEHLRQYFGRTTARAELSVWYFGTRYADKQVPWHYSWMIFATTIPLGTLVFGGGTLWNQTRMARKSGASPEPLRQHATWSILCLVLLCVFCPLMVFSLPGVAVYDCERLFLPVFPLWAILAGYGASLFWQPTEKTRYRSLRIASLVIVILIQMTNVARYSPCPLSFYNLCVGGVSGAERLGLETTYWGDAVTRELLNEVTQHVPAGSTVHVAPVLHQFQLDDLFRQSPMLRRQGIVLQPYDGPQAAAEYLLLFRRRADLPQELRDGPANAELLAETRRGHVQLAALYRLKSNKSKNSTESAR